MALMVGGYMGGFSGRLGTAIGYMWNGKWCLRSRPAQVHNPRTPEQTAHRTLFREEVRLAARMSRGVAVGMTAMARQMGMTCYNLFVSVNQPAFSLRDGELQADYRRLRLSTGPVAPVAFGEATVDGHNVLTVSFGKNSQLPHADGYDRVMVYAYCPATGDGYLSAPVYRRDRRVRFCLPDEFAGQEMHLYGIVQDDDGNCAESQYIPWTADFYQAVDGAVPAGMPTTEERVPAGMPPVQKNIYTDEQIYNTEDPRGGLPGGDADVRPFAEPDAGGGQQLAVGRLPD